MYNIYNQSDSYYLYDIKYEKMSLIGNEWDLINFLAKAFEEDWLYGITNTYFVNFVCSQGDVKVTTRWQFFDGFDRCINPKIYEVKARELYLKKYKDKKRKKYWIKNQVYKGVFRRTPVENISSHKGGPYSKKPLHCGHLYKIQGNPEYKEFNRGDKIDPWFEGRHPRCVERNWKSQRKHQWKEMVNM
jgi:hypothetical protein